MADQLEIRTLGGLEIRCNDIPVTDFESRTVQGMLVYLARTSRAHARDVLAEMFWEGRTQSRSLGNLRTALTNLRQTVGPFLTITRDSVSINADSLLWLDVAAVDAHIDRTDDARPGNGAALERVLDLYQGEFLEGFTINSAAFEQWVLLERERMHYYVLRVLDQLIEWYTACEDYSTAIARANQSLRIDSLRETTHRQLMHLFALSGQRKQAFAQYEACCRVLDDELGVAPMQETVALYERIRAGEVEQIAVPQPVTVASESARFDDRSPGTPQHNLPPQSTVFIGREAEIDDLIARLAEPDCRMITLVGPGGIGKTRLALAVAEQMVGTFSDGVYFVGLELISSPDVIPATLAAVLDVTLHASAQSPIEQVIDALCDKTILLVLDNLEHVLDGLQFVDDLLARAPGVQILATSRAILNAAWEWVYDVHGMPVPPDVDTPNIEHYGAVQLFLERARRVKYGFRLADVRADVVRICQQVEGMPLGIELAASWLRIMSCPDIARHLIDLETEYRDVAARHRSLRVMLDQTWQRLSHAQRDAFARLSVFQGGFTLDAAETVAGVRLPVLAGLVNWSLLRMDYTTGRYTCHRLLLQYAQEQARARSDDWAALQARYAEYFAEFLREQYDPIRFGYPQQAFAEIDNLRAMWHWAREHRRHDLFNAAAHSMLWIHEMQSWDMLGLRLFSEALEALDQGDLTPEQRLATEKVRLFTGFLSCRNGLPDQGEAFTREALAYFREVDSAGDIGMALLVLTFFFGDRNPEQTIRDIEEARALLESVGDRSSAAHIMIMRAQMEMRPDGAHEVARRVLDQAMAINRAIGQRRQLMYGSIVAAWIAHYARDYEAVKQYGHEASTLAAAVGYRRIVPEGHWVRGMAAWVARDYDEARHALAHTLELYHGCGYHFIDSLVYGIFGHIALAEGDHSAAEGHLVESLNAMPAPDRVPLSHKVLLVGGFAVLAGRAGNGERAVAWLTAIQPHSALPVGYAELVAEYLSEFERQRDPAAFAAEVERGQSLDLDQIMDALIAEHGRRGEWGGVLRQP